MDQTGFHNWHHTQSPKVLFIDSQDASHRSPEGHSEFSFVFNDAIHIKKGEGVLVSLLQASVPYSFYNIRLGVNDMMDLKVLKSDGNYADTSITLPQGNYTASSIRKKLKTLIETQVNAVDGNFTSTTVTIDYDRDLMKFKFKVVTGDGHAKVIIFNLTHGANRTNHFDVMIGFDSNTATHSVYFKDAGGGNLEAGTADLASATPNLTATYADGKLVSDNVADLNGGIHSLYIRSNLPVISSMDSETGGVSQILAKIPIMSGPGSIIFHEPQNSVHKSLIQTQVIKDITIRLTDDRNRTVSLNGLFFSVALMFEFVSVEVMPEKKDNFLREGTKDTKDNAERKQKKIKGRKLNPKFLSEDNNKDAR